MEFNIIKLAFLLGYLALLVCVVNGIPFLTALFRSVLVTVIFSLIGFFLRLFLIRIVSSVETRLSADREQTELPLGEYVPEDEGMPETPETAGVAAETDYEE